MKDDSQNLAPGPSMVFLSRLTLDTVRTDLRDGILVFLPSNCTQAQQTSSRKEKWTVGLEKKMLSIGDTEPAIQVGSEASTPAQVHTLCLSIHQEAAAPRQCTHNKLLEISQAQDEQPTNVSSHSGKVNVSKSKATKQKKTNSQTNPPRECLQTSKPSSAQ